MTEAPGPRTLRCALLGVALLFAMSLFYVPSAQADFGIESFSAIATNEDTTTDVLAGSHPYEYTLSLTMNQDSEKRVEGTLSELFIDLPAGFLGNRMSLPDCTRAQFVFNLATTCPGNTQVGIVEVEFNGGGTGGAGLYNLTPTPGSAATFGTHIDIHNALQDAGLRTGGDYGATISDLTIPTILEIQSVTARIWGQPMEKSHDSLRFCIPEDPEEAQIRDCSSDAAPAPFLTMPTRCGQPLETTLRVRSVQGGADSNTYTSPALKGCEGLGFEPQITAKPETAAADSPTGLDVGLHVPQHNQPGARSTAHLKDTVVTLPAGMALNPSAAAGRGACSVAQIDLKGPGPAACPDDSKVGAVSVESPLIDHPLPGSVYLARQSENPFGSLLAIYVTVNDPLSGVIVKLAGEVVPDPLTGQLKATFKDNPQVPFEDFDLHFFGGPRATLTTPPTCGTYTTSSQMTPWSAPEGKDQSPFDSFAISQAAGGGPCPASEAQMPSAPAFEAGTTAPLAGSYSPFVLKVSRENGSQRLGALNLTLPPGLSAKLAGVAECSEPQIGAAQARSNPGEGALELQSPSCPQSSAVGTVNVGAGSGAPIYVQGHAYLAGPYKGAPLSLAIITPAVAGPFDLGVVVVRSALFIDESTAQASAVSDPIPQSLQGIPLDVRSIAVKVDRDPFTLNPTSCEEKAIAAEAVSTTGNVAHLSNRFQVGGCAGLGFKPRFSLRLKGGTRRAANPKLIATLAPREGDANISALSVQLPRSAFLDQSHIRTVCTRVQFAADACPPGSIYGKVSVNTPILGYPLTGNVYLRSSNHKLPDLVADLRGPATQPIRLQLSGRTDSVKGALRNSFDFVPDAPFSTARLELFGGKRGLVVNSRNLCAHPYRATVKFEAHNGKAYESQPLVRATGCKKSKKAKRSSGKVGVARGSAAG